MSEDMVKSIVLALIIISVMMMIVLRSVKIGIFSMLPNLAPLIFYYALFGLFDIWLDNASAVMGCVVVGLAVDDTIHFVTRYHLEFNRLGNYKKALDASMKEVGRAITLTTICLASGLSLTSFGDLLFMRNLGFIIPAAFIIALIADYFIAPSVILLFKPFGKEFIPEEMTEAEASDKKHEFATEQMIGISIDSFQKVK